MKKIALSIIFGCICTITVIAGGVDTNRTSLKSVSFFSLIVLSLLVVAIKLNRLVNKPISIRGELYYQAQHYFSHSDITQKEFDNALNACKIDFVIGQHGWVYYREKDVDKLLNEILEGNK
jgi:hypothetical protein